MTQLEREITNKSSESVPWSTQTPQTTTESTSCPCSSCARLLLCQNTQTLPRVLHLVSEALLKVVTKCIFQELNYFFSTQSIMSYPSQALHIKLFSCCSPRQLLGIKIALRQILEKQLKAWCLGDFCNYELIMVWSWKDLCLWH